MNGDDEFTPEQADRLLKALDDSAKADRIADAFKGAKQARKDIKAGKTGNTGSKQ